jgi:hypothetical protein
MNTAEESKIESDKDDYESLIMERESLEPASASASPKPKLRAVVLDNDETTGSYAIVFTFCHVLRKYVNILDDSILGTIYDRLALHMIRYGIFRPHLAKIVNTLAALKIDGAIEQVIMYTNQTEEMDYNPFNPFRYLVFNVPFTISYLIYSAFGHKSIFDCIIARPKFFRTIGNGGICIKSFSRIFANCPGYSRDTEHILFVDDNAHRSLITAGPNTIVHDSSYYKIPAYVRGLSSDELNELVDLVFRDLPVDPKIGEEVKIIYYKYAPASPNTGQSDDELKKLNKVILNKYRI